MSGTVSLSVVFCILTGHGRLTWITIEIGLQTYQSLPTWTLRRFPRRTNRKKTPKTTTSSITMPSKRYTNRLLRHFLIRHRVQEGCHRLSVVSSWRDTRGDAAPLLRSNLPHAGLQQLSLLSSLPQVNKPLRQTRRRMKRFHLRLRQYPRSDGPGSGTRRLDREDDVKIGNVGNEPENRARIWTR
jgi:hypothetical protein